MVERPFDMVFDKQRTNDPNMTTKSRLRDYCKSLYASNIFKKLKMKKNTLPLLRLKYYSITCSSNIL